MSLTAHRWCWAQDIAAGFRVGPLLFISQVITFKEFLPLLLGPKYYEDHFKNYHGYCHKEDPRIANVFTMTSLWSHTMMQPFVLRVDSEYRLPGPNSRVPLNNAVFATWRVVHEGEQIFPGRKRGAG